jgi:hypothetical protein
VLLLGQTFDAFFELPPELQQAVVDTLEPKYLCQMRLVSQSMYQYVEHSTRWAYEAKLSHFERPAGDEVRLFSSQLATLCGSSDDEDHGGDVTTRAFSGTGASSSWTLGPSIGKRSSRAVPFRSWLPASMDLLLSHLQVLFTSQRVCVL